MFLNFSSQSFTIVSMNLPDAKKVAFQSKSSELNEGAKNKLESDTGGDCGDPLKKKLLHALHIHNRHHTGSQIKFGLSQQ